MIKLFESWLNENENEKVPSELAKFYKNTWTDIKFPWEEEIVEKLEEYKAIIDSLDNDFETNRYGRSSNPTYDLNIKFYDSPAIEDLSVEMGVSDEEMWESWHEYLAQQVQDFADSLDYGWLQDVWQSGRSGGWLTLETHPQYDTENAVDRVVEHLDSYVYEVEDYDPITPEQLQRMRGSLMGSKYGLGGDDKAKDVNFLQKEKDLLIKNIDAEIEMMTDLKAGIEEIQKMVEEGMKGLVKGFDEWIKDGMNESVGAYPNEDGKLCIHCGHSDSYLTKEKGKFLFRCDKCGKQPLVSDKPKPPKDLHFTPGYSKSDYVNGLPHPKQTNSSVINMKKPETAMEWLGWFEARVLQLRKAHNRSMYVKPDEPENVLDKARKLITGEEKLLPYTDMYTSTAGFQWGKEFLDILAHDGLFRVVKRGNRVYAELALPDNMKEELYRKFRGRVMGKRYGL